MAAYFRTDKNVSSMSSSCESFHCPPLGVGERVVWLGKEEPEPGTVKWIGMLPNICTDGWSAGIELDNPVGEIDGRWGGQELFKCPAYHGIVIDVKGLIKEADFLGKDSRGHGSGLRNNKFVNAENSSNKGSSNKNKPATSTAAATPNDVLSVTNSAASTSRSSDVDEVLGGIITTHSTPASCMGSFDRRVYARMFAECEVEKWYEALNYPPPTHGNGPFEVADVESKNERKLGKISSFNDAKMRKNNTLDYQVQPPTSPKKERGGIFKFFRWLSGRSSSRKTRVKKHRRDFQVSELRRGGRTKSLESVTSLSRSFHYIPVGVLCPENEVGQLNDVTNNTEDLNDDHSNSNKNQVKAKTASLSRAMADERERGKRQRSNGGASFGGDPRRHSRQSSCTSNGNSPGSSSNASRKKRKAPLPPTNSPRQHWVKVLPTSSEEDEQKVNSHGFDCHSTKAGSVNDELNNSKLGRASTSHNKNKRHAPAPPKLVAQAEINSNEVVMEEVRVPLEPKTGTKEENDAMNVGEDVEKMDWEVVAPAQLIPVAENQRKCTNESEKSNLKADNLSSKTDEIDEMKSVNVEIRKDDVEVVKLDAEIKQNPDFEVEDIEPQAEIVEIKAENVVNGEEKIGTASSIDDKVENSDQMEVGHLSNNLSIDTKAVDEIKTKSKLNVQMNLQALQELVESLVLQYCETSAKFEDVRSSDKRNSTDDYSNKYQNIANVDNLQNIGEKNTEVSNIETKVVSNGDDSKVDEDLATKLMERWQLRMREELVNLDTELTGGKDRKPKCNEKKLIPSSSFKEVNGSGGIYEPVGNYMHHRHHRRPSVEDCSRNRSPSNRKPPSGRRRMSSASNATTDDDCDKAAQEVSLEEEDDSLGDPFSFWRELDAKECNSNQKISKSIRRLSVNGQRQSMSSSHRNSVSKIPDSSEYDQFTAMAYTNYGYSSIYRHLNWPPPPPPTTNPQVLSMTAVHHSNAAHAYVLPYVNHHQYSAYLPTNPTDLPIGPHYTQTAFDAAAHINVGPIAESGLDRNKLNTSDGHLQRKDQTVTDNRRCCAKVSNKEAKIGKRIYANADYASANEETQAINLSPPPPPPPRASCCSSRLAANCHWLRECGKSVEEKIHAARSEETPHTSDKSSSYSKHKSSGGSPPSPSAVRARRWPLATLENSVVIGGVRVKTPLNLWPLEYELIVPELKRLKARLEGRPLPEDEIVLDETADKETLAINKLLNELELAICNGNLDEAAARARDLAQLKIQCSVTRNRKQPTNNDSDDIDVSSFSYHNNKIYPIIVNMYVEDKISHFGPIPIKVLPSMTIGQLKLKMFKEFEFPVHVQRWILGQRLASDDDVKLSSFGVVSDGFPVYLYLLTVGLNELIDRRKENRDSNGIDSPKLGNRSRDRTKNSSKSKRDKKGNVTRTKATGPSEDAQQSQQKGDTNKGWPCEKCTLINTPTRSGCAMCGNGRPLDYVLPVNEKIEENVAEQHEEKKEVQVNREEEELRRLNNWQQYLNLDDQDVIHNVDPFECGICLTEVAAGGGVQLRDCLHSFCSECLRNVVSHNEEASVRCPYRDHQYSCDSILQEREIRALVPPDVFERYLRRSIATAESQAPNSFHCKTPDCQGWCLYADNANEFLCPSCGKLNCITCRVIHEGINCKQYQDELAVRARTDDEAKKTKEAIEEMVLKGEAMKCPSCAVIVMKKWGCDWIVCSICKVEICWVTKGPRWGPKGRGDLTGGCKCGVNGVRCHPKCNYCH